MPSRPAATAGCPGTRSARITAARSARRRPADRPAARGRARGRLSRAARRAGRDRRRVRRRSGAVRRSDAPPDGHDQGPADRVRARAHARRARARPAGARHLRRPAAAERRARRHADPAHPGRGAGLPRRTSSPTRAPSPAMRSTCVRGHAACTASPAARRARGQQRPSSGGRRGWARASSSTRARRTASSRAIEAPARRFCLGVQWHPEYRHLGDDDRALRRPDRGLPQPMTARPAEAADAPRAHRQAARARGPVLAPRRRALDRRGPGRGRRRGADEPGGHRDRGRTSSRSTASRCPRPSGRGCGAITSRAGCSPRHAIRQGRPTVFDRLPAGLPRLISIGRLDLTSEGLLLLTNDGALARRSSCRRPAGCAATGCGSMARSTPARARRAQAGHHASTASPMARSRPRSTASRAATPGSRSRCARARTARSAACSSISAGR